MSSQGFMPSLIPPPADALLRLLERWESESDTDSDPLTPPRKQVRTPRVKYTTHTHYITTNNENTNMECSICFETPRKLDSIMTSCQHEFCKDCFQQYTDSSSLHLTCPNCRTSFSHIVEFVGKPMVRESADLDTRG